MKLLSLEIQYTNKSEAIDLLRSLLVELQQTSNTTIHKSSYKAKGGLVVHDMEAEQSFDYYIEPEYDLMKPKSQIINGKIVDVYQSRMNQL